MREELVEMAVKFLLHPTVGRSPISQRRLFLENKGLTSDEIDEAFRRVPDATSSVSFRQDINSSQDVQSKPFASVQLQGTPQSSQPLAESMLTVSRSSRFSWSYAIVSVVLLIFSGAGTSMLLKKFFLPGLKSWIRKVVLEEDDDDEGRHSKQSLSKEAIEAAKAAAVASVVAAKSSLQMLQSNKEEGRHFDVLLRRLGIHIAELRSMSITVQRLDSARTASYKHTDQYSQRTSQNGLDSNLSKASVVHGDYPRNFPSPMKFRTSGVPNFDSSVRPSSASSRPSAGQHPKSYMEIMGKIQRGEKPPGIKDIDDSPPNPQITPRLKPWESRLQNNFGYTPGKGFSQPNGENGQPWWRRNNNTNGRVEAGSPRIDK
ncbi:peroxisomal membrane protein PEX14-like isoform X2 [Hibiscus syriacus]|uniref:peroxisomal membrane protein PEX14-like isoform X2 n=1 Tax=Hibiscus syriacus TaxID=106335 RepID=UPI0019204748|nr:peroxisomal membrane protein PEX14-like isoform X2 [Hibiscus syriacus]